MIKRDTILYLGGTTLIIYLLVKFIAKNFQEYNYKKQINAKPVYKMLIIKEQLSQQEEKKK